MSLSSWAGWLLSSLRDCVNRGEDPSPPKSISNYYNGKWLAGWLSVCSGYIQRTRRVVPRGWWTLLHASPIPQMTSVWAELADLPRANFYSSRDNVDCVCVCPTEKNQLQSGGIVYLYLHLLWLPPRQCKKRKQFFGRRAAYSLDAALQVHIGGTVT